jgi:leucyl-tRNA synthetase
VCQEQLKAESSKLEANEFISKEEAYRVNKTIKKVGEDITHFKYNTSIASLMQLINFLSTQKTVSLKAIRLLILILSPFAPYMTEELWRQLSLKLKAKSLKPFVHQQPWPDYDPAAIKEEMVTIVIQVNGKLRDKLIVGAHHDAPAANNKEKILEMAKKSEKVQKFLAGKTIRQTIFVPGKLVNFVL